MDASDIPVDKSPNDCKSYKVISLKNGLTALLITDGSKDDNASLSAAGLCVGIGSFSEPDSVPGLAHFLEHMVFMGSTRFPEENDFDKFIKAHGGSNNAHTHMERTVYFFDIQNTHFRGALERFAQFFISPLLNKDSMKRERILVHAEWAMTVHTEKFRFEQLLASFARPGHPMGKFTWGNSASLKTTPEEKNINVHLELNNFRKEFYQAQYMRLAVFSKDSLEVLENMVAELFSGVQGNKKPAPSFLQLGPPFDTPSFRKLYRIIPAKNIRKLQLTWALDSQLQHYRKKPLTYLANLVGHEGEGSLLVLLRKRNWARNIRSGNAETNQEHNSTWAQFNVQLSLTDEGLSNVIDVISLVFQYLRMLRSEGPQQRLWLEMHHIDCNEFRWLERQDPQEYVHHLAVDMHKYNPRDYITGGRVMREYDEELIRCCLDKLRPDQMNIAVWSKSFENETCAASQTEPWYQTTYYVQDIEAEWIQRWSDCEKSPELFLPRPNVYIAMNFDLKQPECDVKCLERPISSSSVSRLWYRPDCEFCVPKAHINFYLKSIEADTSATNMCLTDIYVIVLRHLVNAVGYPAEMAHLRYFISVFARGMTLRFQGFSDKLPHLFVTIVDCIAAFDLSDQLFNTVHRDMVDFYDNQLFCPERLNKELKKSLLQTKYFSILQKKETLPHITKAQLMDYAKKFYKGMFVEGLVQGNLTPEEALQLEKYLITKLDIKPAKDFATLAQTQITKLPLGCSTYAVMNRNTSDDNTILTNYYQFGQAGLHCQMLNELVIMNMEEPCFAELRSKMQLGYDIQMYHKCLFGIVSFWVTICSQASRFTTEYLDDRMETFLQDYNAKCIQSMTQASFDKFVSSVIKLKDYDDNNLNEEVKRHWEEIVGQTYMFRRHEVEIDVLKSVTLEEFKAWSNEHLNPSETRRKLSVQVNGHLNSRSTTNKPKMLGKRQRANAKSINQPFHEITNVEQYKATCERYTFTRHL